MVEILKVIPQFQARVNATSGVICMPDRFTVSEAVAFKQRCQTFFESHPEVGSLALDFENTDFIDSSGIGALVICHRLSQEHSTQLRLRNLSEQARMVLAMTELDKVFRIDPSDSAHNPTQLLPSALPETHPSVTSKAKRLLDILGACVGLVITAVLWVVVAIAIKLDDGGPIFFGQTRCSWMGKRFTIWKFRSMVADAEARKAEVANEVEGPLFKNENDPRITKIGGFLRKTSLDEFPQFWNVLKGDMSLVGTRPPTPDEIEQYEVPEWLRLNVKPGMTGEWQVNGRSSVKKFEDVIRLDLKYQENWSLWYDIQLIVKTVLVLFSRKSGAV
ncbi:MAG: sugar transferase [Cyanobacteria bacterium P01_D01_bin.14]